MHTHNFVTYEEFGRRFFDVAVTEDRVAAALAEIAGGEFEMGPMAQGPAGLAKVTAKVQIQKGDHILCDHFMRIRRWNRHREPTRACAGPRSFPSC